MGTAINALVLILSIVNAIHLTRSFVHLVIPLPVVMERGVSAPLIQVIVLSMPILVNAVITIVMMTMMER